MEGKLTMPEGDLQQAILDAIIDDPSWPFVPMLAEVRSEIERDVRIIEMLRELRAMCDKRLVMWSNYPVNGNFLVDFDNAPIEAIAERYEKWFLDSRDDLNLSWDPFGLCFEVTDEGLLEWHRNLPPDYVEPPLWCMVLGNSEIVIYAQDEQCVAVAVESWVTTNPKRRMDWDTRTTDPLAEYVLNVNRVIRDGIRVTIKVSPRE